MEKKHKSRDTPIFGWKDESVQASRWREVVITLGPVRSRRPLFWSVTVSKVGSGCDERMEEELEEETLNTESESVSTAGDSA